MPKDEMKEYEFIPPLVNIDLLHENGKLFDDATIAYLKDYFKEHPYDRYSKLLGKHSNHRYGIIKNEAGLYAIYRDPINQEQVELSSGGFGAIKLIQHLDSGKWYILKTQKIEIPLFNETAKNEYQILRKLKQCNESRLIRNYKSNLIIPFIQGCDISDWTHSDSYSSQSWPPVLCFDIMNQILLKIQELHQLNILHRDIKTENIMFDLATNSITIIDFGLSELCKDQLKASKTRLVGTPECIAPELIKAQLEAKTIEFNEKTEIYNVGLVFNELFSLLPNLEKVKKDDSTLDKFINQMTNPSPDERPTFEQAVQFFQALFKNYSDKHQDELRIAKSIIKDAHATEHARLKEAWKKIHAKKTPKKEVASKVTSVKVCVFHRHKKPIGDKKPIEQCAVVKPATPRYK